MRGRLDVREIEDIGDTALSYSEVKALATGEPRILEKARIDAEMTRLERLERSHGRNQRVLSGTITKAESDLPKLANERHAVDEAITRRVDTSGDRFSMSVNGTRWTARADAAIALRNALAAAQPSGEHGYDKPIHVATIAGFDVIATPRRYLEPHLNLELDGVPRSSFSVAYDELRSDRPLGIVVKVENRAADLERTRDRIQTAEHDLAAEADRARSDYGQPFAHTQALADARARSAELASELAERDQHPSTAGDPDPDPAPSTSRWWAAVCDSFDARITADPHWPALAAQLERAANTGTDVAAVLAQVTADKALPDDDPARSLAYRVADVVPDLRSPARIRPSEPDPTSRPMAPPPPTPSVAPDTYRPGPRR